MIFLTDDERAFAQSIVRLVYCNPFLPERIDCERAALGNDFVAGDRVWNARRIWKKHANRCGATPGATGGRPGRERKCSASSAKSK